MYSLVVWTNNLLCIRYFNGKYSLYNNGNLIISEYDSLVPCSNYFFIGSIYDNNLYKYQLLNVNGEKIFGDKKTFDFISFDETLNKFTFYDYFNKIDLVFPKLSDDKNRIFFLFLKQIYSKNINEVCEFQLIVDQICKKIDNLSDEDILKIIENLELTNKLYMKLNKPDYLKDYLIVLDKDDEDRLLNVIRSNRFIIFKELSKDIIKNPKIYELNEKIINYIISNEQITCLNDVLVGLNNIHKKFKEQIEYYESYRNKIFSSLDLIRNYYQSGDTIKYFDENDFNYIKKNKNLFFNIMFNNSNVDILNLLKYYDIT